MSNRDQEQTLVERLRDEAGLCRNKTAEDVANLLEEAANALTAAEKLLRNVHLAEDGESLYSTGDDAHWIKLRDELLGGK